VSDFSTVNESHHGEETYISIGDITTTTQHKQHRLPPIPRRSLILQQPRADDADGIDAAVPNVINGLDTTAREARSHDPASIDVRIRSFTGILGNPSDCLIHRLRSGSCSAAIGATLRDGEEAVARDVLQERRVGTTVGAAGAFTPDQYWQRDIAGRGFGWVVDGVALKRVVGLVVSGSIWACAASLLLCG
jgi:hypothetical protein